MKKLLLGLLLAAASASAQVGTFPAEGSAPPISPIFGGTILSSTAVAVSQAEVQALATTEKEIVAGSSGYILVPRLSLVAKAAGAYTVAGVTALVVGWGTVADNSTACAWSNSPAFSVLVDAGTRTDVGCQILSNGLSGGIPFGILNTGAATSGKKLAIRSTGASPAGAGGALTVRIYYEKVHESFFVP